MSKEDEKREEGISEENEEDSELEEIVEIEEDEVKPVSDEMFRSREGVVNIQGSNSTMQSNLISQPLEKTLETATVKPVQREEEFRELKYQSSSEEQKYDANAITQDLNAPTRQAQHMSSNQLENLGREEKQLETVQRQEFVNPEMQGQNMNEDYMKPVKIREVDEIPGDSHLRNAKTIDKDYTF